MSSEPKPFLPYGRQSISEADITAVVEVLRSSFLTQGPAVPAFEQAVAASVGVGYGVAVNSATSALHLACLALGAGAMRSALDLTNHICGLSQLRSILRRHSRLCRY